MKLEHTLTPYTKMNSKWLKDLNIIYDTIKFLEENIVKTFSDIKMYYLGHSPKAIEIKTTMNKWGTSIIIQWLRPHVSTAEGMGSISGQGTRITQAALCGQNIE